ncbi:type II toxin-antitoxin system HicB family antitoxin [Oryzibacter oryziterrae]|uniref:type II toxin-antitoxin system HicB family antitoxin n=1 Tax=Oryzibacter oryziterrae TaxID=2766474 RepID=UPI001F46DA79|nr:type II toxin-antitoxin system HicB family antitoxin [Oryzibacter oryziterrae]
MTTHHLGLLEKEPGTLWGVFFPHLPGCVAAGETSDEAIANAVEVLRDYLEGNEPTDPPAADALMQNEDVRAALARGAAFVRVPHLVNEGVPVRVNINIDRGALAAIDNAAKAHGMSRSAFLASAALDKIRTSL